MIVKRTIRAPLHYAADEIKIKKLDKITARLAHCVSIFLDLISETGINTKAGLSKFEKDVQKATKLSSGFVQQCRDKAVWMHNSYLKLHKSWKRKVDRCKDEKYLRKLLKRKPSFPSVKGKTPVRLDSRTAKLITDLELNGALIRPMKKTMKLTDSWLNISTLVKRNKMMMPLNLSNYHVKKLKECSKVIDCEIVKKQKKYYIHFNCEFDVKDSDVQKFRAVDLGILRSISTVLLDCEGNFVKNSFKIFSDNVWNARLNEIDERIKVLQEKRNWNFLRKFRTYRSNFVEDYMRKSAKIFAGHCVGCKVFIGHPKYIKFRYFKGNGNKRHRKRLGRWSYGKQIAYIQQACEWNGVETKPVNESYTSKLCSNCGSKNTERPYRNTYSLIHCNDCHKTYNSDFNGAIQIGIKSIASKHIVPSLAVDGLDMNQHVIKMTEPLCTDDPAQKQVRV
jgi:IS605 OrfB family transposase